jgi:hypothetical protein
MRRFTGVIERRRRSRLPQEPLAAARFVELRRRQIAQRLRGDPALELVGVLRVLYEFQ